MIISCKDRVVELNTEAPPSKSIYHRELIVRFLRYGVVGDPKDGDSNDIIATKACLRALAGAKPGSEVVLPCNESGSTLRFMISVACAYLASQGLADKVTLKASTAGRLIERPLEELSDALAPHGITLSKNMETREVIIEGVMTPGEYSIDGSVSSQYISGLLMGLPLFAEKSVIHVLGGIKSVHYIELTQAVMEKYGCSAVREGDDYYPAANGYDNDVRADFRVEGDWSNGAFLLCLGALLTGGGILVDGLNPESVQGDMAILKYLDAIGINYRVSPHVIDVRGQLRARKAMAERLEISFDCSDIPDIAPYMAVMAAFFTKKTVLTGIGRLRIKESDRVAATCEQLNAVGVKTETTEDTMTIYGIDNENIDSVTLSSYNDHRMAMCAIMICAGLNCDVDIDDITCVNKSFPELQEIVRREMMP